MRTSGAGENSVERIADERDVSDAAGKPFGLARRQSIDERLYVTTGVDPGDARALGAAEVLAGSASASRAEPALAGRGPDCGVDWKSALSDIEMTIRAEFEATWVDKSRREHSCYC
jgi:hypothetical protein